jgi:hypothetical protein
MIERPLTLSRGAVDLTLHGTYTNWAGSALGSGIGGSFDGETLAASADFGVGDRAQLGLAVALPIHPGAGFGSGSRQRRHRRRATGRTARRRGVRPDRFQRRERRPAGYFDERALQFWLRFRV